MRAIIGLLLATYLTAAVPPLYAASAPKPPTNASRTQAVNTTATKNAACTAIQPFYWEIGDVNARLGSGSVGFLAPQANTPMQIYSAGKWLYGAYVLKRRGGVLQPGDKQALELTSGYNDTGQCTLQSTVADCRGTIGTLGTANLFSYGPGHFEVHAMDAMGLGSLTASQLAAEIAQKLGGGFALGYAAPHLAGGAVSTAQDYAIFLRAVLNPNGLMRMLGSDGVTTVSALGFEPVCTSMLAGCGALSSPASDPTYSLQEETWGYSLGHWVEPDGSYSSPGAAGFYPWITADKSLYGIVSRSEMLSNPAAAKSIKCGRLLRAAWNANTAQ